MIDWAAINITLVERHFISKILHRAQKNHELWGSRDRLSSMMSLEATHHNLPLDFEKFLEFDDFNFWYDFNGIERHLDTETGYIMHHFLPRCAISQDGP